MSARVEEHMIQYTELVYFNDRGVAVAHVHQNDDHWYDTGETREPTRQEREDYDLGEVAW